MEDSLDHNISGLMVWKLDHNISGLISGNVWKIHSTTIFQV